MQVPIKSGDEVYLTNVDGDGMIWLQREADTSVLMQLDEKIEEYSSELKVREAKVFPLYLCFISPRVG